MSDEKEVKPKRELHPLQVLKRVRTDLAEAIRSLKEERTKIGTGAWKMPPLYKHLDRARKEYRRLHIVYCELRGRARERIEKPSANPKRARCNMVNESKILFEKAYWQLQIREWKKRHPQPVSTDASVDAGQDQEVEVATTS